jgi:hypothetical protein
MLNLICKPIEVFVKKVRAFEHGAGSRVDRDRTESMPFQTYMNCKWINI